MLMHRHNQTLDTKMSITWFTHQVSFLHVLLNIRAFFHCRTARTCLCCPSGTRARPTASRSSGTLGRTTASAAGTLPSLTSRRSTGTSMQPLLQHVSIKWNAAQTHARKSPARAGLGTVVHECSKGEIVRKWKCCHKLVLCMYDLAQCLSGFLMISGRVCTNSILYCLEQMYLLTHLKTATAFPGENLGFFKAGLEIDFFSPFQFSSRLLKRKH